MRRKMKNESRKKGVITGIGRRNSEQHGEAPMV